MAQKVSVKEKARRVSLVAHLPGAKKVVLTGDFTHWANDRMKMDEIKPGEWQATLALPPGQYQYRLLVDGQWRDHPEASTRVANAFGSENCVLNIA